MSAKITYGEKISHTINGGEAIEIEATGYRMTANVVVECLDDPAEDTGAGFEEGYNAGYSKCTEDMQDDLQQKYDEGYSKCTEDMQDDLQAKYDEGYAKCTENMQSDLQNQYNAGYNAGYSECSEKVQADLQGRYDEGYVAGYSKCTEEMQDDLQAEYEAGYSKCSEDMQGNLQAKYNEGYSKCAEDRDAAELEAYNERWDRIQQNGERTDFNYAFYGEFVDDSNFEPKYDMHVSDASFMFSKSSITNLEQILIDRNVVMDFSEHFAATARNKAIFGGSKITHIPRMDLTKFPSYTTKIIAFQTASALKSIRELVLPASGWYYNGENNMEGGVLIGFSGCAELEEIHCITIVDTFDTSGLEEGYTWSPCGGFAGMDFDTSPCPKLSHDTLLRISEALPELIDSATWTMAADSYAKLSESEIEAITQKGWIIAS